MKFFLVVAVLVIGIYAYQATKSPYEQWVGCVEQQAEAEAEMTPGPGSCGPMPQP